MRNSTIFADSGRKLLCGTGIVLLFVYLVICPKQGSAAAARGLLQWYQAILPSLLPLMMISRLLIGTGILTSLMRPLAVPARALFGCSLYGTYAMLAGFLCGYPMGVKIMSDLYEEHLISGEECRRLAPVLNNVSPAFVVNYVLCTLFAQSFPIFPALGALYGGPLLYGFFSYHLRRRRIAGQKNSPSNTAGNLKKTPSGYRFRTLLDVCVMDSIRQIVRLGGYMVFFCVLSSTLQLIEPLSPLALATLSGLLEITGGVSLTASAEAPLLIRYLLSLMLLSFGGLCCALQSAPLLESFGGSLRSYLRSKTAITLLTLLLAIFFLTLPV